ncbi:GyrI-like domain-containing protein [uncultured Clostridium sp.]|uniref:GyrI-like domain-containing protein n=1 Tax=uncultured Clostridium sp. TaxID=59620 RepID=UPI003217053F
MMKNKLDLKKEQKDIFNVKEHEYKKVTCTRSYYIALDGKGDPNNNEEYQNIVGTLYKMAYSIKMDYKKKDLDFVVMPLTGLWWSENIKDFTEEPKDKWMWTMMIQVPDFITKETVEEMKEKLRGESNYIDKIKFIEIKETEAFETLYIGAYKDEGDTIKRLHETIREAGYRISGKHEEIYLSDPRRVEESKLKTIIKQSVVRV